jgi:hypothetical protein
VVRRGGISVDHGAARAAAIGVDVLVGYADKAHGPVADFPSPWDGRARGSGHVLVARLDQLEVTPRPSSGM